jgi:hypothetical protein
MDLAHRSTADFFHLNGQANGVFKADYDQNQDRINQLYRNGGIPLNLSSRHQSSPPTHSSKQNQSLAAPQALLPTVPGFAGLHQPIGPQQQSFGYQQTLSRRGGPSPQSMLSGIENNTGPPHPNDDVGSSSSYHPSQGACSSTQSYQSSFQPFYPFSPSNLQIGQVGPIGPPPVQFSHHLAPGHGREHVHQGSVYYPAGYNQNPRTSRRPVSASVAQTIIPITNPGHIYPQPLFFLASTDIVKNDNQFNFNQ